MNNKPISANEYQKALAAFVRRHGARVRRAEAMILLAIRSKELFKKVVDANPKMKHKLRGEGQTKYLTTVIFNLLPAAARCAINGEGNEG